MWGSAADDRQGVLPDDAQRAGLGLAALNLATGEIAWRASPPEGGGGAGHRDSRRRVLWIERRDMVYAYSTADGKALWQFDTAREFETVNGVEAKGGNINAAGSASPAGCCSCRPAIRISAAARAAMFCSRSE